MSTLISISCLGIGALSGYLTVKKKADLDNKIKLEHIYSYPNDLDKINFNEKINIIKIPHDKINPNYLIGEISLEKLRFEIVKINETNYNNPYNKNKVVEIKKIIENKELIKKQILFPDIYPQIELDKNLINNNKIKVLFDNCTKTKSADGKILFDLYEQNVKKNIPTYYSDIQNKNLNMGEDFELVSNVLNPNKDLYLLVNSFSNKFYIQAMSDYENKIIREKFKEDFADYEFKLTSSILFCSLGILSGVIAGSK